MTEKIMNEKTMNEKTMNEKTMNEKEVTKIYKRYINTQIGELCKAYIILLDENKKLKKKKNCNAQNNRN